MTLDYLPESWRVAHSNPSQGCQFREAARVVSTSPDVEEADFGSCGKGARRRISIIIPAEGRVSSTSSFTLCDLHRKKLEDTAAEGNYRITGATGKT